MKLALDTTLSSGSIALAEDMRVVYSVFFDIRITHSETLMPAIDHALKFCGIAKQELNEIYVCSGPGSFTGLRIGLATAKGIAFGLNIPLYAYSSLELAALGASGLDKPILAVIDAKMKEIYYALYDSELREIIAPRVGKPEELADLEVADFILCGSGTELAKQYLEGHNRMFRQLDSHFFIPNAAGLFALGTKLPEKLVPQDLAALEPLYIRDSTAQIKKKRFRIRSGTAGKLKSLIFLHVQCSGKA